MSKVSVHSPVHLSSPSLPAFFLPSFLPSFFSYFLPSPSSFFLPSLLSFFLPSLLSFFLPLFLSYFQLGLKEARELPRWGEKQKSSIRGFSPHLHEVQFLNEILNHKGHRWVVWWLEIFKQYGLCYFTKS
jgi:hypothetical protein